MHKINHANIKEWAKNYDGPLFDGILCDPPYELGFMGKSWDSSGIAFDTEMWSDIYKLLKPGAHLLAFSGSRTYHRMAVAIEDAGFEIRDMIEWLYGSGFPKSLDISKAIDKKGGYPTLTIEVADALKKARERRGITKTQADKMFCGGTTLYSWYEGRPAGIQLPTSEYMRKIADAWPELEKYVGLTMEAEREIVGTKTSGIANKDEGARYTIGASKSVEVDITIPKTANAQYWNGYGTALKPAHEPCVLARKPLDKGLTVAGNVLKHGTGGLNIDGTRVGGELTYASGKPSMTKANGWNDNNMTAMPERTVSGRFPANLIHDGSDEVEAVFPQTGSPRKERTSKRGGSSLYGSETIGTPDKLGTWPADNGGSASRFFYTAKASKAERNAGLEGFEVKGKVFNGRNDTEAGKAEGSVEDKFSTQPSANHHPTVKPLSLTKYLATLIKPPAGGRLLVPFSGSGSEMIGALQAGWEYVEGVELTEEYIPIAEARIKYWLDKKEADSKQLNLV